MDSRIALASGTALHFTNKAGGAVVYEIVDEIGRGSSCIVYDAVYEANTGDVKHVRIKECYPYKLRVTRNSDGTLESDDSTLFSEAQQRFRTDFSLGSGLFYSADLSDSLTNTIDIYTANGTVYLASEYSSEDTLSSYRPKDIKTCVTLVRQVTEILGKIHEKGYLYLDIKPDNILIIDGCTTRVQLFDLDSLLPVSLTKTPRRNYPRLSYTKGFAAVELQTAKLRKIGPHTDVYGIGALLFWLLSGRTPTTADGESTAVYDYSDMLYSFSEYQDKLNFALTDFFHNTLSAFYLDRYRNMRQAVEALEKIEALADITKPFIRSTSIIEPAVFVGRDTELNTLCSWIESDDSKCIFVTGMGGIGKSTLVRRALCKCKSDIDSILYLDYNESLPKTLSDDKRAFISTISRNAAESDVEYYERKLREFSKIAAGEKIVLVIDNYTGTLDENVREILNIGWKVVFISRKKPTCADYDILQVLPIPERPELHKLFESNLKRSISKSDVPYIDNIINRIAGHTLTLGLIARQIAGSFLTIPEASELVDRHGFSDIAPEKVVFCKDSAEHYETIRGIITALFNADDLSERMKAVLKGMSLLGDTGADIRLFQKLAGEESLDNVNALIRNGWAQLAGANISLHPVIRETIHCWDWNEDSEQCAVNLLKNLLNDLKTAEHDRISALIFTSEDILKGCKREPFLHDTEIYLDLLYCTVQNMPRYREDFILSGAEELVCNQKCTNVNTLMKLYRRILEIYNERADRKSAAEMLKRAYHTARSSSDSYVHALYYDMLSDYYDYILGGAYEAQEHDGKIILQKMMKSIDITIFYCRKTRIPESKQLLAKNLMAKATIIIRNSPDRKKRINRLLDEAKAIILEGNREFDESRGIYNLVCAWYFTLVEPNSEFSEDFMAKAREIYERISPTDLDKIDNVIIPCANMYCLLERYSDSERLLLEGVETCKANETVVTYARKEAELYGCLLDVYSEYGKYAECRTVIEEIDELNQKYRAVGIYKEIPKELRDEIFKSG